MEWSIFSVQYRLGYLVIKAELWAEKPAYLSCGQCALGGFLFGGGGGGFIPELWAVCSRGGFSLGGGGGFGPELWAVRSRGGFLFWGGFIPELWAVCFGGGLYLSCGQCALGGVYT